jgi:hypothetical protein
MAGTGYATIVDDSGWLWAFIVPDDPVRHGHDTLLPLKDYGFSYATVKCLPAPMPC